VLVRQPALPSTAARSLQHLGFCGILSELDQAEERLETARKELLSGLGRAASSRTLVRQLRRAKHSISDHAAPDKAIQSLIASELIDVDFESKAKNYLSCSRCVGELLARAEAAIHSDRRRIDEGLLGLFSQEEFRAGVLFAQPHLHRLTERALVVGNCENARKKDRRSRRQLFSSLYAYAIRAATKTSPLGSLTATAVSRLVFREDGIELVSNTQSSEHLVNAGIVSKLAHLFESRATNQDVGLYLNPTLTLCANNARFVVGSNRAASFEQDIPSEKILEVELGLLAAYAVAIVDSSSCSVSRRVVIQGLRTALSSESFDYNETLDRLIETGLIEEGLDFDCNTFDGIGDLARAVSKTASVGRVAAPLAKLENISKEIASLSLTEASERGASLNRVVTGIRELAANLGGDVSRTQDRSVVHEMRSVKFDLKLSSSWLDAVKASLADISALLPLFNMEFIATSRVNSFISQYGVRDRPWNLMEAFYAFTEANQSISRNQEAANPFSVSVDDLDADCKRYLHERRTLLRELRALAIDQRTTSTDIPQEFVRRWLVRASEFKPSCRATASTGFMAQILRPMGGSEPLLVLNKAIPGNGTLFAQYARESTGSKEQQDLLASLKNQLVEACEGAEPVEILATFGFDGQLRPPLTERCLRYPGEAHHKRLSIPWRKLNVQATERARAMLTCVQTGRRIIPIHVGTMSLALLPPLYRFAMCFGLGYTPEFQLPDMLDDLDILDDEIREYPRLTYGPLILSRRSWFVGATTLPPVPNSSPRFEAFYEMRRWAKTLGLPRCVYVTPTKTSEFLLPGQSGRFVRLRKPFFVDWDSHASYELLCRYLRSSRGTVKITEALPNPISVGEQAIDRHAELVLEIAFRYAQS
jgi:hypothetical protein